MWIGLYKLPNARINALFICPNQPILNGRLEVIDIETRDQNEDNYKAGAHHVKGIGKSAFLK